MALKADFVGDIALRCAEKLREAGYIVHESDADSIIFTYISLTHQRVSARPRTIHKANYAVPLDLVEDERKFLARVEAGEDLWPYQSRKFAKAAARNDTLTDFGIQHFYLGGEPDLRNEGLPSDGDHLLFGIVRDDDFYIVGIFDHECAATHVIEAARGSFPHITGSMPPQIVSDEEDTSLELGLTGAGNASLRTDAVGTSGQITSKPLPRKIEGVDNSTTGAGEIEAKAKKLIELAEKLQQAVLDVMASKIEASAIADDVDVKIIWREDKPFAVTDPAGLTVPLEKLLSVSAL